MALYKEVLRKNVRPFAGKTLVEIAINVARKSNLLSELLVNTDCPEIAGIASAIDKHLPLIRPPELGGDDVSVKDVLYWTSQWYSSQRNTCPDIVVTLQPTSPLRTSNHIDEAISLLINNPAAESVIGLVESEHTPYKMRIIENGYTKPLFPNKVVLQRQDASKVFRLSGIVYATRWRTLIEKNSLWGDYSLPYILPQEFGYNIDTPHDFEVAEALYINRLNRQ